MEDNDLLADRMIQPSYNEYLSGLHLWHKQHPDRVELVSCGESGTGKPLIWIKATDLKVDADLKQVVLLTCTHGEAEISGVCGILHFLKWFIYSDEAEDLRHGVCVAAMPIIHADAYDLNCADGRSRYGSKDGCELYGSSNKALTWDGVRPGLVHREADALLAMMDEVKPDVHLDVHGSSCRNSALRENIGVSRPRLDKCYDNSVVEELASAIDESGSCAMREELQGGHLDTAAREEDLPGVEHLYNHMPPGEESGRIMTSPVMLSYARYHAISMVAELGWMKSVFAACRRLCELGLRTYPEEFFPGYRNHLIMPSQYLVACAWGETPGQRRRSRSELWQRHGLAMFTDGHVPDCGMSYGSCAINADGLRLLGIDPATSQGRGTEGFLETIRNDRRFDHEYLEGFFKEHPPTGLGAWQGYNAPRTGTEDESPILHGLSLRLHLPHSDAQVQDVRLNGQPLLQSPTDGYMVKHHQGTAIHVSIPPDKVGDLQLVTVRFDAKDRPQQGFLPEDWDSPDFRIS